MSGLSYEGMVSLRWQPLDALPAGEDLLQLAGDNERLLQLLPGLESMPESAHDEEAPPRYMQLLELAGPNVLRLYALSISIKLRR